jgi:hypothetical protein
MESRIERRTINERLGESRKEILRFETHAADSESCQKNAKGEWVELCCGVEKKDG